MKTASCYILPEQQALKDILVDCFDNKLHLSKKIMMLCNGKSAEPRDGRFLQASVSSFAK